MIILRILLYFKILSADFSGVYSDSCKLGCLWEFTETSPL